MTKSVPGYLCGCHSFCKHQGSLTIGCQGKGFNGTHRSSPKKPSRQDSYRSAIGMVALKSLKGKGHVKAAVLGTRSRGLLLVWLQEATAKIDEYARGMISGSGSTLFEELGLYYIGPIDGHNLDLLIAMLQGMYHTPPILEVIVFAVIDFLFQLGMGVHAVDMQRLAC